MERLDVCHVPKLAGSLSKSFRLSTRLNRLVVPHGGCWFGFGHLQRGWKDLHCAARADAEFAPQLVVDATRC